MSKYYEIMNSPFQDIINELKLIAINELNKKYSHFTGKKLNEHLEKLIKSMKECKKIKDNSIMYIIKDLVCETLITNSKIKNFNFKKYLNNLKKSIVKKRKRSDYETVDESKSQHKMIRRNNKKVPDEEEYEEEYEEDDEDDDEDDDEYDDEYYEDDDDDDKDMSLVISSKKENKDFTDELLKATGTDTNSEIIDFYSKLNKTKKVETLTKFKEINKETLLEEPLLFKFLSMNIPLKTKSYIIQKYLNLCSEGSNKLKVWIDGIVKIPFGINIGIDIKKIKSHKIKKFLEKLKNTMDNAVYGHEEAKKHIIQVMAQQIRNSDAKGINLGIYGPPGNGKSSLIKEGIAKAMERPFVFISLGGATDASFLEGHSYTYEGSICGRIAQGIIDSKCMNPIIYFDELDKISTCHKGREITNFLVHLIDPIQNDHFIDKYFNGIEFDLSKVTFIFSYNDPSLVDHILMDRITQVETKYLLESQKVHISNNYLLPEMLKEIGFNQNDIKFQDKLISQLINKYTNEGGVRKLKSILYYVLREINICNLTKTKINNNIVKFPLILTQENLEEILKNKKEIIPEKIHSENSCGIINGMYATDLGIGGVMPIQILWTPGEIPFEIKATGNLQLVIKESTTVAATLAFNLLSKEEQDKYIQDWKINPRAIHIHCPDGAVPKDGPSAGTALTVAIYSLLTNKKIRNDIAITGEINLQGYVTAIGGLESKLQGAKRAGIRFALYPKENEKDIQEIKERNPTLIDENLRVQSIEKINDAIIFSIIK